MTFIVMAGGGAWNIIIKKSKVIKTKANTTVEILGLEISSRGTLLHDFY